MIDPMSAMKHMSDFMLKEGQEVTVFNLGDAKEHKGTIRGISANVLYPVYIVEMDMKDYPFSCVTIPASCIKEAWPTFSGD